jgi:hypothetical protein
MYLVLTDPSAAAEIKILILILLAATLYFLPSIIGRKKRNASKIFALNLLLGATVVFWIFALGVEHGTAHSRYQRTRGPGNSLQRRPHSAAQARPLSLANDRRRYDCMEFDPDRGVLRGFTDGPIEF